jgi:hypothetical protein
MKTEREINRNESQIHKTQNDEGKGKMKRKHEDKYVALLKVKATVLKVLCYRRLQY